MNYRSWLTLRTSGLVWVLPLFFLGVSQAMGQGVDFTRAEFSLTVELPETKNDTKNLLSQVDQQLNQKKWQEAIDTLQRLVGGHGSELILQGKNEVDLGSEYLYYDELKTYLQRRISQYSRKTPEFLETYRDRIDPLAKDELKSAKDSGDPARLAAAIDDYFLSTHADEALLFLGDLLIEQGRINEARTAWERISPQFRTPEDPENILLAMPGQPMWVAVDGIDWSKQREYVRKLLAESTQSSSLATVPDSDVDPAAVWARLCLASWLEGSSNRAAVELELLRQLYPDSNGYMGGRQTNYVSFLESLLETSPGANSPEHPSGWPTFAGSYSRTADAKLPEHAETYMPKWSASLEPHSLSRTAGRNGFGDDSGLIEIPLVAESAEALVSAFPIVMGEHLIIADEQRVRAFQLQSGLPSFVTGGSRVYEQTDVEYGSFHSSGRQIGFNFERGRRRGPLSAMSFKLIHALGPARFTLSSDHSKLVARMGSTAIGVPYLQAQFQDPADMIIFDLRKEGRMEARIPPVTELSGPWSFEGTGILEGNRLYVGMTKSGVRDETAVACFDWTTQQMLWRRTICLTQPYGSGLVVDGDFGFRSHNLLTLKDGVLYYNTNHGVIAALEADRGRMLWLTRYPRRTLAPSSLEMAHVQVERNVNPCVVTRGLVVAMPTDCERLFALDAATGQLVWQTVPGGINPVHLIGATDEDILVSGKQLFWVNLYSGRIRAEFPHADRIEKSRGFGRGVIAGDEVFWPTRDTIYRLKTKLGNDGKVIAAADPLKLTNFGEEGGNLVMADGLLVVAAPRRLTVYAPGSKDDLPMPQGPEGNAEAKAGTTKKPTSLDD
ncbi:PQQ-binding-like beta-propeller repeat protein [bacterium]|nr:PQQ-binding-like beta-propeller repeat protein [bacterium]